MVRILTELRFQTQHFHVGSSQLECGKGAVPLPKWSQRALEQLLILWCYSIWRMKKIWLGCSPSWTLCGTLLLHKTFKTGEAPVSQNFRVGALSHQVLVVSWVYWVSTPLWAIGVVVVTLLQKLELHAWMRRYGTFATNHDPFQAKLLVMVASQLILATLVSSWYELSLKCYSYWHAERFELDSRNLPDLSHD